MALRQASLVQIDHAARLDEDGLAVTIEAFGASGDAQRGTCREGVGSGV